MPTYSCNVATEAGQYTAVVSFTYDEANYEKPVVPDLVWTIEKVKMFRIPGDANGNNTVDILDLVAIIDYIVSDTSCASMANADANGDDMVDIDDVLWIINQTIGS